MPRSIHRGLLFAGVVCFAGLASFVSLAAAADAAGSAPAATAGSPPYPRSTVPAHGKAIHFKKTVLDTKFRGEGVTVGDFNHDGKLDIAAGNVYYSAPDWKMHVIYGDAPKEFDPHGYSEEFMAFADDLNHDGWTDYIVVGFPGKEAYWYENPKGAPGPWKRHLIGKEANTESPQYLDIDGNGHRALLMAIGDGQMAILRPDPTDPDKPWIEEAISVKHAPGTDQVFARPRGRLDSQQWPQRRAHSGRLVGIAGRQASASLDFPPGRFRQRRGSDVCLRFQRRRIERRARI